MCASIMYTLYMVSYLIRCIFKKYIRNNVKCIYTPMHDYMSILLLLSQDAYEC